MTRVTERITVIERVYERHSRPEPADADAPDEPDAPEESGIRSALTDGPARPGLVKTGPTAIELWRGRRSA